MNSTARFRDDRRAGVAMRDVERMHAAMLRLGSSEGQAASVAAGLGFEPRFTASKAAVLPLNDPATRPHGSECLRIREEARSDWATNASAFATLFTRERSDCRRREVSGLGWSIIARLVVGSAAAALVVTGVACGSGGGSSSPTSTTAAPSATAPAGDGTPALAGTAATTQSPGDGAIRLEKLLSTQGYDAYYEEIHPVIRRFIEKQVFLDCASKGTAGITRQTMDSIEVGLVRNLKDAVFTPENFVPETDQPKVVTLGLKHGSDTTAVNRRVAVADGQWKWFMSTSAIQAYQAQKCPGEGQ